jgi:hypothetical protein
VTAGAVVYNVYAGSREKTFSAVYQRMAEGGRSEKIKMDSPGGMLLDSVIDSASMAAFKGVHSTIKSKKTDFMATSGNQYSDAVYADYSAQTEWSEHEVMVPHGAIVVVKGNKEFIATVCKHLNEIQKHISGREVLEGLVGRRIEIRPPRYDDLLRTEDDGRCYFGSRVVGGSIFFDPYNTYYGADRNIDAEEWRNGGMEEWR